MTHTSREYAEALFELAAEEDRAAEYDEALTLMETTLAENPAFLDLLSSPAVPRQERQDALSSAFEDRVPLSLLLLTRQMVFRGHARDIPGMIGEYRALVQASRGETTARVISAVPLTDAERETLAGKLEARFGRKMNLVCEVDPALLGGLRVETEGRVLDGSLRARLQELKEVMNS